MILEKDIANDGLIIYLFNGEDILAAGEFHPEIPQSVDDKVVIEALLKSPDENDAGFIMFEIGLEIL